MASPQGSQASSPLSNIDSDDYAEDYYQRHMSESAMPAPKRQRIDEHEVSHRGTPVSHRSDFDNVSIASDTSGDVPNSPGVTRLEDEDGHHEQVTVCSWDGCDAGDCGDMDRLVAHIHNDHIEGRGKKYTCEWGDCSRKSHPHASAYALKAHMRSHTREKPFYCALPGKPPLSLEPMDCANDFATECDRSFTRSDALAKHMRTVHETEALRPSDPVPKSNPAAKSNQRLKLIMRTPGGRNNESQSPGPDRLFNVEPDEDGFTPLTTDMGFTEEELALGPKELFRLCRRQLKWAEEDKAVLQAELETMTELRDKEWLEKEILLDKVIKGEMDWLERRRTVLAHMPSVEELTRLQVPMMRTETPKVAPSSNTRDEAAEALASMAQADQPMSPLRGGGRMDETDTDAEPEPERADEDRFEFSRDYN